MIDTSPVSSVPSSPSSPRRNSPKKNEYSTLKTILSETGFSLYLAGDSLSRKLINCCGGLTSQRQHRVVNHGNKSDVDHQGKDDKEGGSSSLLCNEEGVNHAGQDNPKDALKGLDNTTREEDPIDDTDQGSHAKRMGEASPLTTVMTKEDTLKCIPSSLLPHHDNKDDQDGDKTDQDCQVDQRAVNHAEAASHEVDFAVVNANDAPPSSSSRCCPDATNDNCSSLKNDQDNANDDLKKRLHDSSSLQEQLEEELEEGEVTADEEEEAMKETTSQVDHHVVFTTTTASVSCLAASKDGCLDSKRKRVSSSCTASTMKKKRKSGCCSASPSLVIRHGISILHSFITRKEDETRMLLLSLPNNSSLQAPSLQHSRQEKHHDQRSAATSSSSGAANQTLDQRKRFDSSFPCLALSSLTDQRLRNLLFKDKLEKESAERLNDFKTNLKEASTLQSNVIIDDEKEEGEAKKGDNKSIYDDDEDEVNTLKKSLAKIEHLLPTTTIISSSFSS